MADSTDEEGDPRPGAPLARAVIALIADVKESAGRLRGHQQSVSGIIRAVWAVSEDFSQHAASVPHAAERGFSFDKGILDGRKVFSALMADQHGVAVSLGLHTAGGQGGDELIVAGVDVNRQDVGALGESRHAALVRYAARLPGR